jgi:hypothetical protein
MKKLELEYAKKLRSQEKSICKTCKAGIGFFLETSQGMVCDYCNQNFLKGDGYSCCAMNLDPEYSKHKGANHDGSRMPWCNFDICKKCYDLQ